MLRAVAFDMDGVLVDTEGFYDRRRATYLARELPGYTGQTSFSGSNEQAIWEAVEPEDEGRRRRLREGYDLYRREHPERFNELANPDVPEVLRSLRARGLAVAIASSSPPDMVTRMMDECGIAGLVDFRVSGCEVEAYKPSPAIYLHVMRELGVAPGELAVVEDSPIGIAAGRASGARVVALAQYVAPGVDQSAADVRIARLRELPEALAALEPSPMFGGRPSWHTSGAGLHA